MKAINERIEGQWFVGEQTKHAADVVTGDWINVDDSATITPDISIPVWSASDEPAFSNSPIQTFSDIERLLLGVEARHICERPSHHPASGIAFRWLRYADEGDIVFRFEAFDLDKVEEIASSPVDFVDE